MKNQNIIQNISEPGIYQFGEENYDICIRSLDNVITFEITNIEDASGRSIFKSKLFYNNLVMLDCCMPILLMEIIKLYNDFNNISFNEILGHIMVKNPLNIEEKCIKHTYTFKIGRLLFAFVVGLNSDFPWNGETPSGVLCYLDKRKVLNYHNFYEQNNLCNFLINHAKLIRLNQLCKIEIV